MRILRLAQSRVVLWAQDRNGPPGETPFEVSKVVDAPLQPRCPTAPSCPQETEAPFSGNQAWINPRESPPGICPYAFTTREGCLEHRNQRALEIALFRQGEADAVRKLLEALGYVVRVEPLDPVGGGAGHILRSHGYISPNHEVRLLNGPRGGQIVLVRDPGTRERRRGRRRQPRPMGGLH